MLSFISSDLVVHLIVLNGCLILSFIWIHHHYHSIFSKLEEMTMTSKYLDERQKRILKRFFPFYNKLSPSLQRLFEQKLLYFYYMKEYEGAYALQVDDRMKLFVSAYAAQISLGFRGFGFSHIYKVKVYSQKFESAELGILVSWNLDSEGTLHISWTDFFIQLKKKVILPIGLQIMAHAIKKDENTIKTEIFSNRSLLYSQPLDSETHIQGQNLFKTEDFQSKEDFMEACLKNYFGNPVELKNSCPNLFKKLDHLFYSQIKFTR
jgi:hypothetical protein